MSRFSLVLAALAVAIVPALAQENAGRLYGVLITTNIWTGVYTDQQSARGGAIYTAACSGCHGDHLEGDPGDGFPALANLSFMVAWDGQTVADLVHHIHVAPNDTPGDMDSVTAVELAAFILNRNGVPSGTVPLSTDEKEEARILFTDHKPQ